ncbi:MAG TPA: hypothetical protein VGW34_11225, partial [Allosphingosinicella sp.]|nr:hypothetical protein [Allosphingosinicella sp.]
MEQKANHPPSAAARPAPPSKPRSDGFSAERKRLFVVALRRGEGVLGACAAVGVSNRTAYNHRARDPAFAREWALARSMLALPAELVAYERAVIGVAEPVHTYGRHTHNVVRRSDSLLRTLLVAGDPEKYGPRAGLAAGRERIRRMVEREVAARLAPLTAMIREIVNFMNFTPSAAAPPTPPPSAAPTLLHAFI